jgi:predicted cupin superfamily sugar epimerase
MAKRPSASDIIASLDLKPHPEGGHYRETFRDPDLDTNGRSHSTAIYFLLGRGERSHWHRIDAVEVWHYYAGDALTLRIANDTARAASPSGQTLPQAKSRKRSCRRMPGRRQKASVTGR